MWRPFVQKSEEALASSASMAVTPLDWWKKLCTSASVYLDWGWIETKRRRSNVSGMQGPLKKLTSQNVHPCRCDSNHTHQYNISPTHHSISWFDHAKWVALSQAPPNFSITSLGLWLYCTHIHYLWHCSHDFDSQPLPFSVCNNWEEPGDEVGKIVHPHLTMYYSRLHLHLNMVRQ